MIQCDNCDKKVTTTKQLEKHMKQSHVEIIKDTSTPMEMEDDDIIILDQEEEQTNDTLGQPSVGKLLNICNESIITELTSAERNEELTKTKDEHIKEEDKAKPVDEGLQAVKISIYKFHDTIANDDDDELDTFTYSTYYNFEDDMVLLEDEENSEEKGEEDITNPVTEEVEDPRLKCGECGEKCKDNRKLDDHMEKAHPPRQSKLRTFGRIGFIMMST